MANNETAIMHRILLALSQAGCLVWRSNVGTAWQGRTIHQQPGVITLKDPRMIRFGLCEGAADIIGIAPGGKFLAIEVKADKGRTTTEQKRFINAVITAGGIAGVARSEGEAVALLSGK